MPHLRTLGAIAAASAILLLALAGTASASRLCAVSGTTPCPAAQTFPANSSIVGQVPVAATFTTSGGAIGTVTCTNAQLAVRTTSTGGGSGVGVNGVIDSMSFGGCTDTNSVCSASAAVSGLGGSTVLDWTAGANGSLGVGAFPTVSFTCRLFGIFVACTIGNGASAAATFTGGAPANMTFSAQPLPASGATGCPTSATFNGRYTTTPSAVPYYMTDS
jgi:hypothetical protein